MTDTNKTLVDQIHETLASQRRVLDLQQEIISGQRATIDHMRAHTAVYHAAHDNLAEMSALLDAADIVQGNTANDPASQWISEACHIMRSIIAAGAN